MKKGYGQNFGAITMFKISDDAHLLMPDVMFTEPGYDQLFTVESMFYELECDALIFNN